MSDFSGFTSSETFTQIPDSLLALMSEMDDLAELKVTLFAIWRIEHIEGHFRGLREADFESPALGLEGGEIRLGLEKAVQRGILLRREREAQVVYFLNSPRGRLSAEAFEQGQWSESAMGSSASIKKSNLFKLYEENIGALTPLLSDMLREAEKDYPAAWFEEAFEIAVSRNICNWKYVEAILTRWKEKGKDERKDNTDVVKDAKRYSDSEFSDFFGG